MEKILNLFLIHVQQLWDSDHSKQFYSGLVGKDVVGRGYAASYTFWINLYTLRTCSVILSGVYPLSTALSVSSGGFFFDCTIASEVIHRILKSCKNDQLIIFCYLCCCANARTPGTMIAVF